MKCRSFFQHATHPSHPGQYLLAVQVEKHDAIHESAVFVDPTPRTISFVRLLQPIFHTWSDVPSTCMEHKYIHDFLTFHIL